MKQLLKIILLSFSITAVESGILYLLLVQQEKQEHAVVSRDPLLTDTDDCTTLLSLTNRRDLPAINTYRRFPASSKAAQHPRSDGRVYHR